MRNSIRWAGIGLCLGLIVACTGPEEQAAPDQSLGQGDVPILQGQIRAVDKARNLTRSLQQAEDARRRKIEAETQ